MFMLLLHRFATLATRMEQYIQGQSRDLVDQAYTKFVSTHLPQTIFFFFTFWLWHMYKLANIVDMYY